MEQAVAREREADRVAKPPRVELALREEILRAVRDRLEPKIVLVEVREHDDREARRLGAQLDERPQSLAVREHQVRQHDVVVVARQEVEPRLEADGALEDVLQGLAAGLVDVHAHQHRVVGIVFDEQDSDSLFHKASGKTTVKRVPRPTELSTEIVPPWRSTIFLQIARPIPLPG
jgi:hypothetical protein